MARFLTPAKLGLLVLIELYTEEAVPSSAILPVLSFITSHLTERDSVTASSDSSSRWTKAEETVNLVITIKDFEKLLGSYPFLMGMPGRKLWDQFLSKLWNINSLDALHVFIDSLSSMLVKPKAQEPGVKLSRNSLFGTFIRKSQMELGRLPWHETTELWKDFVRYRQPTAHYLRRRVPGFGRLSFDHVLLMGEQQDWDPESISTLASVAYGDMLVGGPTSTLPVSTDDIETLLEFQIEQMQST
jgi:anaphase-promoting complex subunit 5